MAPTNPGWSIDAQGRRTWPVDRYLVEGPRAAEWLGRRVVKQHRTIGTTLNLLIGAGFMLQRVEEFCPTEAQIAAMPELAEERERPMFLLGVGRGGRGWVVELRRKELRPFHSRRHTRCISLPTTVLGMSIQRSTFLTPRLVTTADQA